MASWVTTATAARGLPSGYAAVLTTAGTTLAALITEASDVTRARLESRYWPFLDHDATGGLSTPAYVQQAVGHYTRYLYFQTAAHVNQQAPVEGPSQADTEMFWFEKYIGDLMEDPPKAQIPTVQVTAETIAFGDGDPIATNEHKFTPSGGGSLEGFEVIKESVVVSGDHENYKDFVAELHPEHRAWILRTISSEITTSNTVSYRISYLRRREVDSPVSRGGIELVRA